MKWIEDIHMIKGLIITPPVLGRISIGKVVEKNGKRLPEKDDQFTITSQIHTKEGWVKHPLDEQLRAKAPNQKLRSIPVRMLFDDPELNLRAEYTLFDRQTGRPVCIGDGETCQRRTGNGVNNILVHHLICAHWHKGDSASPMPVYTSTSMNRMNSVALSSEPQALIDSYLNRTAALLPCRSQWFTVLPAVTTDLKR
jgi:hypothetical protein